MPFRSRTESIYSPRRLKAVQKQKAALQLRIEGKTWYEIARILRYKDHSGPIDAVKVALKRIVAPEVKEYRELTLERLTQLLSIAWPRAVGELSWARTLPKGRRSQVRVADRSELRKLGLSFRLNSILSLPELQRDQLIQSLSPVTAQTLRYDL